MPTIEDVRDYWDRRPCNTRHSWVNIDEDALLYSNAVSFRKYYVEPHIISFAQFSRWGGKRVLDYGCGIGTQAISFAQYGADVVAVDISRKSIEILKKRRDALGLHDRIHTAVADIELPLPIPYPIGSVKESFDLVWSFGVIHHTPNPIRALINARYYLKPGGTLKVMLYHRYSSKVARLLLTHPLKFLSLRDVDRIVALGSEAQGKCPITRTYTKGSARRLLQSCGFTVEKMRVEHIFPYRVFDYINGEYVYAFPWKPIQIIWPSLFHWLEHQIGWHLCITASKEES